MENRTTERQKAFRPKRPVKRMPNQRELLERKKGQLVKVAFLDGKMVTGTLLEIGKYECLLAVKEKEQPVIVYKHAIKYLY
ncbi:hypothetical protein [Enterococcus sp. 5B3_DIV0040]|uniref:hypothetical protein n=1 Tax=Enterococcus sp. 5B3_DIV0040 TaxID=1834182 RepID=UPI000B700270|nr:hypothetical protein [Enterococcus sp. 5B3_DIV0040]OTO02210.1 hypothetical protein A5883_003037 [Enterococcus sp. 5B3_DIV0040]